MLALTKQCYVFAYLFIFSWSAVSEAMALPEALAEEKPERIVSLSVCTDQILLMLVSAERIAALSHLAKDPAYSYMWQQAAEITSHHGQGEEIVPLKADLIIATRHSNTQAVNLLQRLQQPVQEFVSPATLKQAKAFTRAIGQAVGESEKAERIIQTMAAEIAKASRILADKATATAITYAPNGYTAGKNTLKHEILTAAGYRNLAAELGIENYGNLGIEQLLLAAPEVLILEQANHNSDSLAYRFIQHPALQQTFAQTAQIGIDDNLWLCPGPLASKAILALAEQHP